MLGELPSLKKKGGGKKGARANAGADAGGSETEAKEVDKGDVKSEQVYFSAGKDEAYHAKKGYKKIFRRLRANLKVTDWKDYFTMSYNDLHAAGVVVFPAPAKPFDTDEIAALHKYLEAGGSVMFLAAEGGDAKSGANINKVTAQYGITLLEDSVVRTVYHKYPHPKEVFISNGVVYQPFAVAANRAGKTSHLVETKEDPTKLEIVYPYGCSLEVKAPAQVILSSGFISYPVNRPICAVAQTTNGKGRICVMGSARMFDDEFYIKEGNLKVLDLLVKWCLRKDDVNLLAKQAEEQAPTEYNYLPDTESLSERLKPCLEESDPLPKDFSQLFDDSLYHLNTDMIPEAIALYKQLDLKHAPLSLIAPEFETPLPPLEPAVFPPCLRELQPPALDQFDLDEHFATAKLRLAQLTNKCKSDDDVEYYVLECGDVLEITQDLPVMKRSAKHILEYCLRQLINFKKMNHDGTMGAQGDASEPANIESKETITKYGGADVMTLS
jgi:intraflagellar transport protein 52